jgi:hypothetical protein
MTAFLNIFRDREPLEFYWMKNSDGTINVDRIVGFGCLILAGLALAVEA